MSADEAVAIARAFSSTRDSFYWNDANVTTWRDIVADEPCWMVRTSEHVREGATWMDEPVVPALIVYIVSIALHRCIGFDLERGRHMLPVP